MLIKACLNGSRAPGTHPALPLTPDELAQAGYDAVAAGAGALHIHPRRADGSQSLAPEDCAAAIVAVRMRCPGVPLGLTTAAWIELDPTRRLALIAAWQTLPDFVSVNFNEPGTLDLCNLLLARGIGVEAGLDVGEDAQLLASSGLAPRCLRILIEPPEQDAAAALQTVREIEQVLDEAQITLPRLLHGYDATAWPVLETALQRGYDTRIGLEDTLTLPDGRPARDNAELVALACNYARRSTGG